MVPETHSRGSRGGPLGRGEHKTGGESHWDVRRLREDSLGTQFP